MDPLVSDRAAPPRAIANQPPPLGGSPRVLAQKLEYKDLD